MGIREALNKHPGLVSVAAGALLVGAILIMFLSNQDAARARVSSAYYSADDGKTFFADDIDRVYPFDHNGSKAYRAYVYQCADKPPFVSYLARYDESVRSQLEKLSQDPSDSAKAEVAGLRAQGIEIKAPGESAWVAQFSEKGQTLARHPSCSDGATAKPLSP